MIALGIVPRGGGKCRSLLAGDVTADKPPDRLQASSYKKQIQLHRSG
jgi:hypothetical protein